MSRRWYVVRTKPQAEYIAADALRQKGYEHFFPTVPMPLRRFGKKEIPLFPGYLFLRCDWDEHHLPAISLLPGVLGWVRFDGATPPISDEIIGDLARRLQAINEGGGTWTRFKPGQTVRLVSGNFESLARVIDEPKSPYSRVRVLMEFMGQFVSAKVPWNDLRMAPEDYTGFQSPGRRRRTRGKGRWIRGLRPEASMGA